MNTCIVVLDDPLSIGQHSHNRSFSNLFQQVPICLEPLQVAIFVEILDPKGWKSHLQWNYCLGPESKVEESHMSAHFAWFDRSKGHDATHRPTIPLLD